MIARCSASGTRYLERLLPSVIAAPHPPHRAVTIAHRYKALVVSAQLAALGGACAAGRSLNGTGGGGHTSRKLKERFPYTGSNLSTQNALFVEQRVGVYSFNFSLPDRSSE